MDGRLYTDNSVLIANAGARQGNLLRFFLCVAIYNICKFSIVPVIRLMTAGRIAQRLSGNVPFGTPAEVQSILVWGRSLGCVRESARAVGLKYYSVTTEIYRGNHKSKEGDYLGEA